MLKPPRANSILVVDDHPEQCRLLEEVLTKEGFSITLAFSAEEAIHKAKETFFDLVLSDIRMAEMDGLGLLREFKQWSPQTIVILMTAFGSLQTAVEAMRSGAFDYVSKPFRLDEIVITIHRALDQKKILTETGIHPQESASRYDPDHMVGQSRAMTEIYKTIALAAKTTTTVLIRGESGTGKELVARAIHANSDRSKELFFAINCAGIPEGLLESELFGHEKGAFTGAVAKKPGLFERAEHGTLFLDEIADTSLGFQSKLLRVIEQQEIKHVGGVENIKIDVRIIAATNQNLEELVQQKHFREDLYYRLNVVTILIPPLRERKEDIHPLVDYFLRKYNTKLGKNILTVDLTTLEILKDYPWPGNIREMEHAIERAIALTPHSVLLPEDFPPHIAQMLDHPEHRNTLDELEKSYILQVLQETKGNRSKSADILGVDRKTLYRKALKYGIDMDKLTYIS